MIVRRCAGGVVFYANKVLIVKNDRGEWTLPKGKILGGGLPYESAVQRVKVETGIDAKMIDVAGDTMYEFFSRSRQQEVCNTDCVLAPEFQEGGFYKVKDALEMLSHHKEQALVEVSYKKFKELKKLVSEGDDVPAN